MARIRCSFTIGVSPEQAQTMFERDILASLQAATAYGLAEQRAGLLVLSDGAVDVTRVFDPRRVAEGEGTRRRAQQPAAPEPPPRPRLMGVVAPNVENRKPWLYAVLRGLTSRRIVVRFTAHGELTRIDIEGSAGRDVRDALGRLGQPGQWPPAQG